MEYCDPLPVPLKSKIGIGIPSHIQEKLSYQWRSAHIILSSSISLSQLLRRLCRNCCVLLIPSITSTTRSRRRTKRSPINRRRKKINDGDSIADGKSLTTNFKNEMVIRCAICNSRASSLRNSFGCYREVDTKSTGHLPQSVHDSNKLSFLSSPQYPEKVTSQRSKPTTPGKFSFLDSMETEKNRRRSAPAYLGRGQGLGDGDFVPVSSSGSAPFLTSPKGQPPPEVTTHKKYNLIELERERSAQKKRRKRTSDSQEWSAVEPAVHHNLPASNLSVLTSMLSGQRSSPFKL